MFDAAPPFEQGDWKTRSAEETVSFLNENFGPEDCDRLAFVAGMINVAIYEKRPNEALYWSIVFARRERRPLNEEVRGELQALLEDSRQWEARSLLTLAPFRRTPLVEKRAGRVRQILRRAFRGFTER